MELKRFLLLFTVLPFAFSALRNPVNYGDFRDGATTASFYAEQLTTGSGTGDLLSTTYNTLGLAAQIHPILGAFAGGLQLILSFFRTPGPPTENPLAMAIRRGFSEVNRLLERNLNAIKNVKYELEVEIRGLSLAHQIDDIESLVLLYERFVENPDDLSLDDFLYACVLTRVHEKPLWFTNALTAQNPSNLKYSFLKRGETVKLNSYYQQIISLFYQSTLMDSVCTALFHRDKDNETVQMYIDRRGDEAEEYLREIGESLQRDSALVSRTFINFAVNDVENCANENANKDNLAAAKCLNATYQSKYGVEFFVAAYGSSEKISREDNYEYPYRNDMLIQRNVQSCKSYAHNFLNLYKRNYAICFPSTCNTAEWKKAADSCLAGITIKSGKDCQDHLGIAYSCLQEKRLDYTYFGCFKANSEVIINSALGISFRKFHGQKPFNFVICK